MRRTCKDAALLCLWFDRGFYTPISYLKCRTFVLLGLCYRCVCKKRDGMKMACRDGLPALTLLMAQRRLYTLISYLDVGYLCYLSLLQTYARSVMG